MVPRYVLQLLFRENHKIVKNSAIAKARENISTDFESLEFCKFFDVGLINLKIIKFYLTNLATCFYQGILKWEGSLYH
jgi:hypothetical protein